MAVKKLKNLRQTHYASVRALLLPRKMFLSQLLTVHIVTRWSALVAVPTMLNFPHWDKIDLLQIQMMLNNVTDFGCYRQKY